MALDAADLQLRTWFHFQIVSINIIVIVYKQMVAKAFDKVDHSTLPAKLNILGIKSTILN